MSEIFVHMLLVRIHTYSLTAKISSSIRHITIIHLPGLAGGAIRVLGSVPTFEMSTKQD